VLLGGSGFYIVTRLGPVLIQPINPAYAAQTIERSEPSLKNSLLNYLLLRRERAAVHRVFFDAMQWRAAADVSRIEVEQTVDRGAMIRAGYVLSSIMIVAAAYKVLSPKDPVQTAQRIVSPWSDIARPARVTIEAVEPGDGELFRGQTARVSAQVRGVRDREPVRLVYSTDDGQTVDRELAMQLDASGLRHEALLPPDGGMRQDTEYRIVAGDGVSRNYRIRVVAAPVIEVRSVEYEYPAYTRRPKEVVEQQGDLKALEGTRVTIRALANQPIRSATLEFNPPGSSPAVPGAPTPAPERILMTSQGSEAVRAFHLELSADRRTPRHGAYAISFISSAGIPSVEPVVHRIEIIPDLPPEIEILAPKRERVEVPVSGRETIEVRAIDPDYGLSQLRLKAVLGNMELLNRSLLATDDQTGQVVARHEFRPLEFGLSAGDEVNVWAVAEDNRTAVGSDTPQPNSARTRSYQIIVVPDPPSRRGEGTTDPADQPPTDGSKSPSPQEKPNPKSKPEPASQKKSKPETAGNNDRQQKKQPPPSEDQQDQSPSAKKRPAEKQPGGKKSGGQQSDGQGQGQGKGQEKSSGSSGKGAQQGEESGDQPKDSAGGQGERTGDSSSPDHESTSQGGPQGDQTGESGQRGARSENGTRGEPLHDGEVFEKTLRRMNEQQPQGGQAKSSGADRSEADRSENRPASDSGQEQGRQSTSADRSGEAQRETRGEKGETADRKPSGQPTPNDRPTPGNDGRAQKPPPAPGQKTDPQSDARDATQGGQQRPPDDAGQGQRKPEQGDASQQDGTGTRPDRKPDAKRGTEPNAEPGAEPGAKSGGNPDANQGRPGAKPKTGQKGQPGAPKNDSNPSPTESADSRPGDDSGNRSQSDQGQDRGAGAKPQTDPAGKGQPGGTKDGGPETGQPGSDASRGAGSRGPEGRGAPDSGSAKKSADGGQPTAPANDGPGRERDADANQGRSPEQDPTAGDRQAPDGSTSQGAAGSRKGDNRSSAGDDAGGERARSRDPSDKSELLPGDAVNMDYARRATDLVLDYLRDQRDKPDRELLDDLGWTPDDLRAFLERWEKLKTRSREDAGARRELDESLRSLGLTPAPDRKRAGSAASDDVRGMRESGIQSAPPPSYQEQFRQFMKGAGQGPAKP
jgi:hypothetical protein